MLISSKFVLTAGHCVEDKNQVKKKKCKTSSVPKECYVSPDSIRVCLLTKPDSDVLVKKKIHRIIPHPSYHPKKVIDDIALIQLEHPVRCSYLPRPICLPTKNLSKTGTKLIIAGYGFSNWNKVMGKQVLKEGFVTQVDSSKCPLPKNKKRRIVCAGGIKSNQSSCQGDSGTGIITLYKTSFLCFGSDFGRTIKLRSWQSRFLHGSLRLHGLDQVYCEGFTHTLRSKKKTHIPIT
ncbi:vitamin K-dependent protein C [Trichonephila inaurata madagascariensis]|uniref:Vitamin K-dependent protein C n=1 Tax=Trichonephila inaurata madagascariensis TaxID=2747483 RepID=A0A8X7BUQ6_9ARAC|nr:vitamin K-dependent protein C [Trichonephila inaurata madagascariensis]